MSFGSSYPWRIVDQCIRIIRPRSPRSSVPEPAGRMASGTMCPWILTWRCPCVKLQLTRRDFPISWPFLAKKEVSSFHEILGCDVFQCFITNCHYCCFCVNKFALVGVELSLAATLPRAGGVPSWLAGQSMLRTRHTKSAKDWRVMIVAFFRQP